MGRALYRLTDAAIKAAARKTGKAHRLSDGGGLYLRVSPSGARSWSFLYTFKGERIEIGMGSYPGLGLASARRKAADWRTIVSEGGDLRAMLTRGEEWTFAETVERFLATMETQWSNAKHRHQWRQTLGPDYCGAIQNMPVSQVGFREVLAILKPIWISKPETANRLRGRIERVLNFAKVEGGWRPRDELNPAAWRGNLDNALPKQPKLVRGHMPAMPYQDVPAFMARLRQHDSMSALALQFLILTACRPGEVFRASWAEIDMDAAIWTIPAERMKARREHRVPLTDAAMAVLRPLHVDRFSEWVFPGQKPRRPLSDMALAATLRRMKADGVTAHGFRSSLRDWAGDETAFPREVAEGVLAHQIGSGTERAYRRADALEKRRQLLAAWADYLDGGSASNKVVRLAR